MLSFMNALFGCAHHRCTFPMTATRDIHDGASGQPLVFTYVVCLECGKEFRYDWQQMKVVGTINKIQPAMA